MEQIIGRIIDVIMFGILIPILFYCIYELIKMYRGREEKKILVTPTAEDFHTAADWLDINDADIAREACSRVAKWLRMQGEMKDQRDPLRAAGVLEAEAPAALAKTDRK